MSRTATLVGYALLGLGALVLEVAARWSGRLPTLGEVLAAALRRPLARVVLQAAWLWLGWHLFVRVDWR